MMLMTKFGKFKLRLIATINMGVLLSIFNIASTTTSSWYKWSHSGDMLTAGLWRVCTPQGECGWRNGIFSHQHSFWSMFVRVFLAFGTIVNILVVIFLLLAFFYKMNKRSKCTIQLMEWANCMLIGAFLICLIGFGVFLGTPCNFSMWLHLAAMCIMICTSNMITRTFATLYFKNTRLNSKSVDAAISTAKLPCGEPEEKIALSAVEAAAADGSQCDAVTTIEMQKMSNNGDGSKEALIQTGVVTEGVNTNAAEVANMA